MQCFDLSIDNHVAHLVLKRASELNTMNATFWCELDQVLTQLHREGGARALVISSTGKHFTAGMALDAFGGSVGMDDASPEGRAVIFDSLQELQSTFSKLESLRMPVIAAIQGGCIGGGVDLVSACCIRYASAEAFFCIQEINIGMVADVGTLQRLPKLIPLGLVRELAYTGRRLGAQRALACGLVNEIFDTPEALLAGALQCAREIAAKPPVAIWGTKQVINYTRDHSVEDSLRQMSWLQGAIWSNAHVGEAIGAMKDKRAGNFPELAAVRSFLDQAT